MHLNFPIKTGFRSIEVGDIKICCFRNDSGTTVMEAGFRNAATQTVLGQTYFLKSDV